MKKYKIPQGFVIVADWAEGSTNRHGIPLTGQCPQAGMEGELKTRNDAEAALPSIAEQLVKFNQSYAHCSLVNLRIVTNAESGHFRAKCYQQ